MSCLVFMQFITVLIILTINFQHLLSVNATTTDIGTYWTTQLNIAVARTSTPPTLVARYFALLLSSLWNAYTDSSIIIENDRIVAANYAAYNSLQSSFPSRQINNMQALKAQNLLYPPTNSNLYAQQIGTNAANQVIENRVNDGFINFVDYVVDYNVGKWQPTPTAFTPLPLTPQFGKVKPFVINDINDYLLSGPPLYSSNEYQDDYLFTYNYGSNSAITSPLRSQDETDLAFYWSAIMNSVSPPGYWIQITQNILATTKINLTTKDILNIYRTVAFALNDVGIAAW